jgi:type II secretory pathway component PulJ
MKKCKTCPTMFEPSNNRHTYCKECSAESKRKLDAKYKRDNRELNNTLCSCGNTYIPVRRQKRCNVCIEETKRLSKMCIICKEKEKVGYRYCNDCRAKVDKANRYASRRRTTKYHAKKVEKPTEAEGNGINPYFLERGTISQNGNPFS